MSVERSTLDVGGSPRGAVFLSYASQDADAAKRICDALRAAGVEVWFDQNELVGGDAWDAKIRGQISSCALFMPIISANTQARLEGYFRLEWKLAAQRTHTMADEKAFLLPILIDGTRDAEAKVPAEFKAVQWTKLPGGETPPGLVARVQTLLDGGPRASVSRPAGPAARDPGPSRQSSPRWRAPVIAGGVIALLAVMFTRPWDKTPGATAPAKAMESAAPTQMTPAQELVAKARTILEQGDELNHETYALAEELLLKAEALDVTEASAWILHAKVSASRINYGLDGSAARREALRTQTGRAIQLAPGLIDAQLAECETFIIFEQDVPGVVTRLQALADQYPSDWRMPDLLSRCYRVLGKLDDGLVVSERAMKLLPDNPGLKSNRINGLVFSGRWAEAAAEIAPLLQGRTGARLLAHDVYLKLLWSGDLAGAATAVRSWPAWFLLEDRGVGHAAFVALWNRDPGHALEVVRRFPRDYIRDFQFNGPTAVLSAWANEQAGNTESARADWRVVLQVAQRELQSSPDNPNALHWKAWALARLGDTPAAASILQLLLERNPAFSAMGQFTGRLGGLALMVGRTDLALAQIALNPPGSRAITKTDLRLNPLFDPLRSDPRFQAVIDAALGPAEERAAEVTRTTPDAKSIAVLPFENMSEDKDSGYFADGVQEDILTNLASLKELRVISRTSVERYRKTDKPVPQIARELGVAYLLEGSVRRAGNKVRVTGQLIRAATDEHLWAKSFDRDLSDIFAIQSELAQAIAAELKTAISPAEAARVERRPTNNLEAYDLYLRAREIYSRMGAIVAQEPAQREIDLLQRAVKLDPQFVRAWEGLATAHANLYGAAIDRSPDRLHRANAALAEIVKLAPDSREAHEARGSIAYALREYPKAFEENEWVREHYPQEAHPVFTRGIIARRLGRWTEALATLKRAAEMDPASIVIAQNIALHLYEMRRYDEARAAYRRVGELRPEELEPGRLPAGLGTLDFLARGSTAEGDAYFAALSSSELATPAMAAQRKGWALLKGDFAGFEALATQFPELDDAPNRAPILAQRGADPAAVRALLEPFMARCRDNLLRQPDNAFQRLSLAWSEAVAGDRTRARADVEAAMAGMPAEKDAFEGRFLRTYASAVYAWIGDRDQANNLLAESLQVPPAQSARLVKVSLLWLPLHDDPRFQALVNDPKNNAPIY